MKLYAAASDTNPLDAFVGKGLWVKVIIDGEDQWYYNGGYSGPDQLYYITIIDVDLEHDRYKVCRCACSYLDPDGWFYGELTPEDLARTAYISRSLTLLFYPVTVLTNEEVWDTMSGYTEEDN